MYNVHQNSHESFLFIRDNDCGQEQNKKRKHIMLEKYGQVIKYNDMITKPRSEMMTCISFQPVGQGSQISTGSHPSHLSHSTI